MIGLSYAIYPPAEHGLPWLAVVLKGAKPIETFGCPSRAAAERILLGMKARTEAKRGMIYAS
jgi:hypothetical protein